MEITQEEIKIREKLVKIATVNKCKEAVKEFYKEYLDKLPDDTTADFIDLVIIEPNKKLSIKLEMLKGD